MKYTIFHLLTLKFYIPNLVKIGSVVLEKILTHYGRHTTHDERQQPKIAIGYLSDSSDLKKSVCQCHMYKECVAVDTALIVRCFE